jgi:NTE family protein
VGLCLSGGGYRAALFHLGALRRLDELGVLGQVRTISAVSGGAIIANLLADPRLVWPEPVAAGTAGQQQAPPGSGTAAEQQEPPRSGTAAEQQEPPGSGTAGDGLAADGLVPGPTGRLRDGRVQGFDELVAGPLERLTQRNIRTPALLTRLLPWRWGMPDGSTRALADQLADAVPWWSNPLRDTTAGGPAVITGATEIAYGVDWTFAGPSMDRPRGRIGDYRVGYAVPPPELRVADAIAASCAFPPYFEPMAFDGDMLRLTGGSHGGADQLFRDEIRRRIRLTDGGVYDNLALEPVWKNHSTVLVSDGGSVFRVGTERTVFGRLLRIMAISSGGGTSVRLRWLHASFAREVLAGATWSLDTKVPQSYPAATVELVNAIRTDLDAFSRAERHVLERHGYLVADAAIHRHQPELVRVEAPLRPPHPDVADSAVVERALRRSAPRTLLGHW